MRIQPANLDAPDVQSLLTDHLQAASEQPETHAYTLDKLCAPDVFVFSARNAAGGLMGFAALKIWNHDMGEIKSVRTHPDHLRQGVSTALMEHVTLFAKQQGLKRLNLETHPTPAYQAALRLYEKLGFRYCGPFGDYRDSATSVFMSKTL